MIECALVCTWSAVCVGTVALPNPDAVKISQAFGQDKGPALARGIGRQCEGLLTDNNSRRFP
jgi:hypothetical protein